MALANYADLVASLNNTAGWLHRNDLAAIIPDWVTLCETTINKGDLSTFGTDGLRTLDQEVTRTLATTANVQTVSLPVDYLDARKVYITVGGARIELIKRTALPMDQDERASGIGTPRHYIISGSSIVLFPIPDRVYSITLLYFQSVGPLVTQSTNWLMTAAPGVYLSGAIAHGSPWLGAQFNAAPWVQGFKAGMKQVIRADNEKRSGLTVMRSEAALMNPSVFNINMGT